MEPSLRSFHSVFRGSRSHQQCSCMAHCFLCHQGKTHWVMPLLVLGGEEGMHHLSRLRKDMARLHPFTQTLQEFGKSLFTFPIPSWAPGTGPTEKSVSLGVVLLILFHSKHRLWQEGKLGGMFCPLNLGVGWDATPASSEI